MPGFNDPQSPARIEPLAGTKAPLTGKQKGGVAAAVLTILAAVYANEGGYVNNRNDPGGATNYGITEQVARQSGYLGDMRAFPQHCTNATITCADKIYVARYIEGPGYMPLVALDPAVAEEVVDSAVNTGPYNSSEWLQRSLNGMGIAKLKIDRRVGSATINAYAALQKRDGKARACVETLNALDSWQAAYYRRLAASSSAYHTFLKGWLARRINNVDRRRCGTATAQPKGTPQ